MRCSVYVRTYLRTHAKDEHMHTYARTLRGIEGHFGVAELDLGELELVKDLI